jgi:beta-glucanase (GH16 family)
MASLGLAACSAGHPASASETPLSLTGRTLTFNEDFDRLSFRQDGAGVWTSRYWYASPDDVGSRTLPSNNERQLYVDPGFRGRASKPLGLNPFKISQGILTITATRTPEAIKSQVYDFGYLSGLLTTKDSYNQKFGYFEIRARLPKGKGLWPAFWLLPADGSWPPEIDVMEALGHEPTRSHHSLHWTQDGKKTHWTKASDQSDLTDGFHTFGVDWTEANMRWYVDRKLVAQTQTPKPINKPMYLLVNLAVGGYWPGDPDATTAFPAGLQIDYIRAYSPRPAAQP